MTHAFACGVRPPHLLKRKGEFEDNLAYDMMLHREFDIGLPLYAQADEVFADLIRQFDIPAANKMLDMPTLRKVLLPTIRAEFGMAYNFEYQPIEPFVFPISSFVGNLDPWVSKKLRRLGRAHPRRVHQSCAQRLTFFDGGRRRVHSGDHQQRARKSSDSRAGGAGTAPRLNRVPGR